MQGSQTIRPAGPLECLQGPPATGLVPVALITAAYIAAGGFAREILDWPIELHPLVTLSEIGLLVAMLTAIGAVITVFVLAVAGLARRMTHHAGRHSAIPTWAAIRHAINPFPVTGLVMVFGLYILMIDMFIGFKEALPAIHPFTWDADFMRFDRVLHLGKDPWQLLQPVLGHPRVTDLVDGFYYLWFAVNILCLAGFLWVRDGFLKRRFYISFWLTIILLGTVLAYILSSAGPCYYALVTGSPGPYQPLMGYLRGVDMTHGLQALYVQEQLWMAYTLDSSSVLMTGISAMPSLHVALPILWSIAGWRVHRGLGTAFAIFAAITFLGSIHLGWHYAIDGYVAAAAVPAIWWLSAALARLVHEPAAASGDPW